ncbi:GUB_WAK_bind domain-containing protein [Psidium guajava]|nr:GUB_WAK_bind domain-containing protein [Psidium guajava]
MKHNAEPDAVYPLMEVEDLDMLMEHVDSTCFKRTCLYLTSAARYLPGSDDMLVLDMAYMIYLKFEECASANALQIAHCSLIICRVIAFELDEEMVPDDEREALQEIINYTKLSEGYLTLAWILRL